jgi:predicted AAA+ superfamily ATPase
MERPLAKELIIWKSMPSRLPLIVRGARQVGKSYLIEKFGKEEFEDLQVINFEKKTDFKLSFDSLEPKKILSKLELLTDRKIVPGKTLLFLDEIQDCPEALKALRYFAEEMPELHVIAAGSLLEFILEDKEFSFPVGRVQILNLGPLTFLEYLLAMGKPALVDLIQTVENNNEIDLDVHNRLLKLVEEFLCIGGMPGVVMSYKASGSYLEAKRKQSAILDLYALDFGKYVTKSAQHRHLKKLFEKAPNLAGKHFKFSKIDPDCKNPARDYRETLDRLRQARLILPVHATKGNSLPLRAEKSEKKFKIFLLDVGLLVFSLGWDNYTLDGSKKASIFRGVVAEQFVSQELCALQDPYIDRGLYFWENTDSNSTAEIDFLVNLNQRMLPIEVKSGATGKLGSLKQFMSEKKVNIGLRISERPLEFNGNILSVPFYLVGEIPRLLQAISMGNGFR